MSKVEDMTVADVKEYAVAQAKAQAAGTYTPTAEEKRKARRQMRDLRANTERKRNG